MKKYIAEVLANITNSMIKSENFSEGQLEENKLKCILCLIKVSEMQKPTQYYVEICGKKRFLSGAEELSQFHWLNCVEYHGLYRPYLPQKNLTAKLSPR